MIDILYLANKRHAFTNNSLTTLLANTPSIFTGETRVCIYTDGDHDLDFPDRCDVDRKHYGGPVAIMNAFLDRPGSEIFCKIDNDVIVPPGWFEAGSIVMNEQLDLSLLGIEPPRSRVPRLRASSPSFPEFSPRSWRLIGADCDAPGFAVCSSIGGIGFMRRSAWGRDRMSTFGFRGVGGFTTWQTANPAIVKGWIMPSLKVFLLDRLPVEPWLTLSKRYIADGVQRPWANYDPADAELWQWWTQTADAKERD